MDTHLPECELYAIRYAERDTRRSDHFIGGDPHGGPMPMDYFVGLRPRRIVPSSSTPDLPPRSPRRASDGFCAARSRRCPWSALTAISSGLEAYDTWRAHAPSPHNIIPGHDPLVTRQCPAPRPKLAGAVVRLDVVPRG
jgi:hypothetical protein